MPQNVQVSRSSARVPCGNFIPTLPDTDFETMIPSILFNEKYYLNRKEIT